jgi:hypothetical protein
MNLNAGSNHSFNGDIRRLEPDDVCLISWQVTGTLLDITGMLDLQ